MTHQDGRVAGWDTAACLWNAPGQGREFCWSGAPLWRPETLPRRGLPQPPPSGDPTGSPKAAHSRVMAGEHPGMGNLISQT